MHEVSEERIGGSLFFDEFQTVLLHDFVDMVHDVACDNGIRASMYPDTSGDVVIIRNWTDSDGSDVPDGKDVVYGQDMCHQYPAIGRIARG